MHYTEQEHKRAMDRLAADIAALPEHTPGPWKVKRGDPNSLRIWANGLCLFSGGMPGTATAEANAELLVRAVNAHDDLLAVCEAVLARMELEIREAPHTKFPGKAIVPELRAAIAKAKGTAQ